ncbi:MAG: endolytic transglycosylase MltG [Bacteroidetes bacterium]|nr:MAG: endolytic transglycosylase MltG [Bacteroidota bacterium]
MKKIFLSLLLVILISAAFLGWKFLGPGTEFSDDRYFLYVKTGMNFDQLNELLEKDTVLRSPAYFKWLAKKMDYNTSIKAGKYEIRRNMNLVSMLRMLKNGRQTPVNLVITKLRTKEDLAGLVGRKLESDSASFLAYLLNNDSLKQFNLDTNTVMTAIFPNTYTYFWNTTPTKVFKKLFAEHKVFWTEDRLQKAEAHQLNPVSAYILASIVEEETNQKDDKGKVASVYLNRLAAGMKLAADPTVKYALRNFELKRIYDKYLLTESPYNTYRYAGLPPGPICTPSPETIDAVLNAPKTNYLYFVAKPDFSGYSNFSENFQQHIQYAKQYQKALDEEMKIANEKTTK